MKISINSDTSVPSTSINKHEITNAYKFLATSGISDETLWQEYTTELINN